MKNCLQWTFRTVASLVAVYRAWRWCLICLLVVGPSGCSSSAEKASWESLQGPEGRFVTALAKHPTDPRTLYAGILNGGMLESTDGGRSWHHLPEGGPLPRSIRTSRGEPEYALDVESIDVSDDGYIFVATRGGGVCSRTQEREWIGLRRFEAASLDSARDVTDVALGGGHQEFVYAGTQEGVYVLTRPVRSSDAWERLDEWEGSQSEQVQTLFASQEVTPCLYVGTQRGFFYSIDGGQNWHHSTQGIDWNIRIVAMAVDPGNLDHLVVSDWDRHVYASTDGGETWRKSAQVFDSVVEDLVFSAGTPGITYGVTYSGSLYISQDGGLAWQLEDRIGVPVLSLLQTDNGRLVAGTDGDGIRYRDSNGEWDSAQIPRALLTVQSLFLFDSELYAGTECCGVFRRTSSGEWQHFSRGLPLQARSIRAFAADDRVGVIYVGTYGDGVHARVRDSDRWGSIREGLEDSALLVRSLVLMPLEGEPALLAGTDNGLYRLREGTDWEQVAPFELQERVDNLLWEPSTQTLFTTATGGHLYMSRDGGKSWSPDVGAPAQIERLALSSSTWVRRLFLGEPRWTLFAQTKNGELYYCTSDPDTGWRQIEVESDFDGPVTIWRYPHQPTGVILARIERGEDDDGPQLPPPSYVTLKLEGIEEPLRVRQVNAGVTVIAADPRDREVLYTGTANKGVYSARIALPSLWEQIPAGSLIKVAPLPISLLVLFAILLCALYRWLTRPPKPMELEIEIAATAQVDRYRIQALGPEQQASEAIVSLPRSFLELKESRGEFFTGSTSTEEIGAIGRDLFDSVFGTSAIQRIYTSPRKRDREPTLRLRLYPEGELAVLPWEVLYDPLAENFLALTRMYSITRRTKSAEPLPEWKPSRHLNILAVIAAPRELPIPMIEREVEALREMSGRLRQIDVRVIEHATPKALLAELQANAYQILHFAGHADRSGLILENERGHQARLGVLDLAPVISGSALSMVFLNACETAGSGFRVGIPSLASMLASKGVPLVLAMQHKIPNDDALLFVHSFYSALVDTGSVDDSVSRARQAIYSAREGVTPPTWAIPVLLIRGSNSELIRPLPRWRQGLGFHRRPIQKGGKPWQSV